jgi:7-cyano-7-deazaguanine reductase
VINLDKELVSRIKGLKLEFKEVPQPELLIRIPNRNPDVNYEAEVVTHEFTSLCPLNLSQPDYATISVKYRPGKWLVELKSLKFFLVSFRMVPIFHEEVPAEILKSLVELLEPKEMEVVGYFSTRGGIETTVKATYKEG